MSSDVSQKIEIIHFFLQFFLNDINYFIQQGYIKLIKSNSKNIYRVKNNYISNKICSFELYIHQRILNKNVHTDVFNVDNNMKYFLSTKSAY